MLVPPDTETDYGDSDDDCNGEQHWPDFQNPSDCGFDEKSGKRQHEGGFQNLCD